MKQRGFTVVELLVVIIVMAILLTLAVVNVRSTQQNARDNDRRVDIENIASALESYYTLTIDGRANTYPTTAQMSTYLASTDTNPITDKLDPETLKGPNESTIRLVMAANSNRTTSGISPALSRTRYIYQPLTNTNTLCTSISQTCTSYILYYQLEGTSSASGIETECDTSKRCLYRSKHQ